MWWIIPLIVTLSCFWGSHSLRDEYRGKVCSLEPVPYILALVVSLVAWLVYCIAALMGGE